MYSFVQIYYVVKVIGKWSWSVPNEEAWWENIGAVSMYIHPALQWDTGLPCQP